MEKKAERSVLMEKYELVRLLGRGTFAKVYHGKHLKTGQNVAIKVIEKKKILKGGLINQIKTEISVMRLVRHPNVVELHEVMASRSKIYFVMEYAKGGELFDKVSEGRLSENAARRYFQQLISAVDFCHSRGVYHRDLKPENLLLDDNGNLKISDFGLSALRETSREDGLLHTTCGSPSYVAPEVISNKGYDGAKADVWSCGVVLYVLLAGYLPFHDTNLTVMYRKISIGRFQCPNWFAPEVKKLLSKILDPRPQSRINLAKIMQNLWFSKGFNKPNYNQNSEEGEIATPHDVRSAFDRMEEEPNVKATSMNAFDIIAHGQVFNLTNLFETKANFAAKPRFSSKKTTSTIVSKFEEIAKARRFEIRKKDGRMKLQSKWEGRKGMVVVEAEIFEITPLLHMVELKKAAGDTLEYNAFCEEDLKPALNDIPGFRLATPEL
ncbi:hypothetical protein V2J09_006561 [Rumex salicifolius]